MKSLINYFTSRPLVANVIMFGLILSSILMWNKIGKEEMPEFAMNWVRVSISYPGAPAKDVELFITKPIEEKLKGLSSLEEVSSTSAFGTSSFRISFSPNTENLQERIQDVKDSIDSVQLPSEAEDPVYRQFRSSEKAIIDIGLYLKDQEILSIEARNKLQKYVLAFKERILSLPEISGVDTSGYLQPELQIKVDPEKLKINEISMNQIQNQIAGQHIRKPIGSLKDKGESDISLVGELDSIESLEQVIVRSGFEGQNLKLSRLAKVQKGYEESNSIIKVQGREGVVLNIKKSSSTDILSAQQAVTEFIKDFENESNHAGLGIVTMDDESYDVRNRIALISSNGIVGFILIIITLFIFLDFKSGFWVGMGIPFCLSFTLICAHLIGYTVNNMTLAAIIIVLGIVVDDAIIVAENISRKQLNQKENAETQGALEVFKPVLASILTTCAAFIPLYFFDGRFGIFVKYIPAIVFMMLIASLLESFLILPSHIEKKQEKTNKKSEWFFNKRKEFIYKIEQKYLMIISKFLKIRVFIILGFTGLLLSSFYIYKTQMKYVMFPREESKDFKIKVVTPKGTTRYDTAKLLGKVEDIFINDTNNVVVGVRSSVGLSRRGGQVKDNEGSIVVEVIPPDERELSLNQLFKIWQKKIDKLEGFSQVRMLKSRFGSDSGSAIEIEIRENDDQLRKLISQKLKVEMEAISDISNVEIEKPIEKNEYQLLVNKKEVNRLGIDFNQLSSTIRSYVQGSILYTINSGDEEIDVRFTSLDNNKSDIQEILKLTVSNNEGYLIPIENLVSLEQGMKPANIQRTNFKRTVNVYADLSPATNKTPLDIATILEQEVFKKITKGHPSVSFTFKGEIKESRDSQSDFLVSVLLVLSIIYILLVFLFNSLWTPLLIGTIIPFGVVGVIFAFWSHGMSHYGFFAVIGVLGMLGVVINDSIVLVDKLESTLNNFSGSKKELFFKIAQGSSTRLRAIIVTTVTTVVGLFPTAYGLLGYDAMLAEMMLAMCWGLLFGMFITIGLVPCLYSFYFQIVNRGCLNE